MERESASSDRREQLVRAAGKLIQRQGYARTTLAEIAQESGVPLGSMYYYFKTKDEVFLAINERRLDGLRRLLMDTAGSAGPRAGLEALIQIWVRDKDVDALHGCPIGSICYELAKQRGALSEEAAKPLKFLRQWSAEQFRLLGCGEDSAGHALHLVTVLQGASLVANAFGDPDVIVRETDRLRHWLESLAGTRTSRAAIH